MALGSVQHLPHRVASDPLELADYRRLFRILEDVASAGNLEQFREQLLQTLARHLGWTSATVIDGPSWEQVVANRPGLTPTFTRAFVEEYLERWYVDEPFVSERAIATLADRGLVVLSDLMGSPTQSERVFVDRFLRPHRIADMAGIVVDTSAGVLYVGVTFPAEGSVGARERAILQKLRRQLAPMVKEHLRSNYRAESEWDLTEREHQVAGLVAQGLSNLQIAQQLQVTTDTVKKHLTRALAKMQCASRTQLALLWQEQIRADALEQPVASNPGRLGLS